MSIDFEDITDSATPDTVPELLDVEYPCTVCGREAGPYAGRGRKPTKCPEHKPGNGSTRSAIKTTGSNKVLAGQAADALAQLNGVLGIGAMAVGFNKTARAIAVSNDGFREQAYEALVTDPVLCRLILKGGATGGKMALILAYVMLGVNVAPVAKMEYDEKKAEREGE
jgi:hypothetical protein